MEPDLTLGGAAGYYCLREGYLNMFSSIPLIVRWRTASYGWA